MTTFELWSIVWFYIMYFEYIIDSMSCVIFKNEFYNVVNVEGGDTIETLKWNKLSNQSLCVSWGRGYK